MQNINKKTPKILLFDIETFANLAYVWGKWEQNIIEYNQHWYILCFAYKWLHSKQTHTVAVRDFKQKNKQDDYQVVKKLWELFNEADIVLAHNGIAFDVKKVNARFLKYGLPPPSPYKIVDTRNIARKYFKFDSNKLDDLGDYLGLGRKVKHEGFSMWLGCEAGDKKSWNQMLKYNKQDVILMEKIYLKMLPYIENHPNYNIYRKSEHNCPNCGSESYQKRGKEPRLKHDIERLSCNSCGKRYYGNKIKR